MLSVSSPPRVADLPGSLAAFGVMVMSVLVPWRSRAERASPSACVCAAPSPVLGREPGGVFGGRALRPGAKGTAGSFLLLTLLAAHSCCCEKSVDFIHALASHSVDASLANTANTTTAAAHVSSIPRAIFVLSLMVSSGGLVDVHYRWSTRTLVFLGRVAGHTDTGTLLSRFSFAIFTSCSVSCPTMLPRS